nr:ABC transporter permease [uncultured Allomuricauda sp.]
MKTQLFKSVLRNLLKKKFLSSVKILGLIAGYGVFIFLAEKIQYETSYDQFWNESESVYRVALDVSCENGEEVVSAKNFHGSTELLDEELAEVDTHCNLSKDVVTVFNGPQQKIQNVDFIWSDPTFFEVFDREIIDAKTTSLLENIHGVAISQSFAKKLYGAENPIGKELTVNEGWKFVVDAVFEDIPENSHLKVDVVCAYKTLFYYMKNFDNTAQVLVDNPNYQYVKADPYTQKRWRAPVQYRPYCYIKLDKGFTIGSVSNKVGPLLKKVALPQNLKDATVDFIFQPIADIHLKSKLDHELSANGELTQVFFLGIIILVVLLVCLINFINLNTISTIENAKNYSIRILNGSRYGQVFQLLFIESLLFNLIAIGVSLVLAYRLIITQIPSGGISSFTLLILVLIGALVTLVACIVPFISVVRNKAFSIVRSGSQKLQQKWTSQKIMVTMQFSITIILIICTIGIYKQMQFVNNSELGFSGNQTLFSFTPMSMNQHPDLANKLTTFKNEVSALGGIVSFSTSSSIPGRPINRLTNQVKAIDAENPYAASFEQVSIDDAYMETYSIPLIAGGNLSYQNDWNSNDILVNRTALSHMGFANENEAVGKSISISNNNYEIRGVVEDYHHVSLHTTVKPTIYSQNLRWDHSVGFYSFRLSSNNIAGTTAQIQSIWNQLYPKEEFIFSFSNTEFEAQYLQDQRFNQILSYSTILALLISCLGLLGVALFNTKKRVKEIGVRKVNGAKIQQILFALNRDFIKWVAIAYVIACPMAWFVLDNWLESFAYKTTIGIWIYLLSGLVALIIAMLTVSWQSFKAAIANPVESLRTE